MIKVTMGDHFDSRFKTMEIENNSDSETSNNTSGTSGSCEDLPIYSQYQSNMSEFNEEITAWILKDYSKSLAIGNDVKKKHNTEMLTVEKRMNFIIGNEEEKKAALHKLCDKLAECYYKELRQELVDACQKYCSTKNLEELKGFSDIEVCKKFEEINLNTSPQSKALWLNEREHLRESVQNILLEKIASLTKVDQQWLENVCKQQYEYFEVFILMATEEEFPNGSCHWIDMKKEDDRLMELIGYIVYKKTQPLSEYSEEELNRIKSIVERICAQSTKDPIKLSCFFLIYQLESKDVIEPVFRVKNNEAVLFIDTNERVYVDCKDFEKNNKLPPGLYCYPLSGEYSKRTGFQVTFTWSPASYTGKKVMGVFDVVGKVVTVGSAAALGVASAVQTLPRVAVGGTVAAVASGAYGINRGIRKILDKVSHVQSVGRQDGVNVLSNVPSVDSEGVAEVVPDLATMGSSVLFTQSAVQGLNVITSLAPEYENNTSPLSGELSIKTLLFFNSNSPTEAIDCIKETYNLPPNMSTIYVIKSFVIANSIQSAFSGSVQKYISKSLTSLVLTLLDAVGGGIQRNFMDTLFLRDVFNHGNFTALNDAFTNASKREKTELFRFLMDGVAKISSLYTTCVTLRSYRGVEFHPVSEIFEQIDFAVISKGSYTIDSYLEALARKKLQDYINQILTLICDEEENIFMNLSEFTELLKSKWPKILVMFDKSKNRKKVRFESS